MALLLLFHIAEKDYYKILIVILAILMINLYLLSGIEIVLSMWDTQKIALDC